ncbi:MAG: hypothetical protein F6K24_02845 [Okeania sp. SIO2D1]|nr:hypothetical protein [Okeania sp. SIO2D1]
MGRSDVINHPQGNRYLYLREDYLAICDLDKVAALILDLFEYWTGARLTEIQRVKDYNEEAIELGGKTKPIPTLWLYEPIKAIVAGLVCKCSERSIKSKLSWLVKKGFLSQKDGDRPWDKTKKWKLDVDRVQEEIDKIYNPLKPCDIRECKNFTLESATNSLGECKNFTLESAAFAPPLYINSHLNSLLNNGEKEKKESTFVLKPEDLFKTNTNELIKLNSETRIKSSQVDPKNQSSKNIDPSLKNSYEDQRRSGAIEEKINAEIDPFLKNRGQNVQERIGNSLSVQVNYLPPLPNGPWKGESDRLDPSFVEFIAQKFVAQFGDRLPRAKTNVACHLHKKPEMLDYYWEEYKDEVSDRLNKYVANCQSGGNRDSEYEQYFEAHQKALEGHPLLEKMASLTLPPEKPEPLPEVLEPEPEPEQEYVGIEGIRAQWRKISGDRQKANEAENVPVKENKSLDDKELKEFNRLIQDPILSPHISQIIAKDNRYQVIEKNGEKIVVPLEITNAG